MARAGDRRDRRRRHPRTTRTSQRRRTSPMPRAQPAPGYPWLTGARTWSASGLDPARRAAATASLRRSPTSTPESELPTMSSCSASSRLPDARPIRALPVLTSNRSNTSLTHHNTAHVRHARLPAAHPSRGVDQLTPEVSFTRSRRHQLEARTASEHQRCCTRSGSSATTIRPRASACAICTQARTRPRR